MEKSIDGSLLWHVISSTLSADMGLSTIMGSRDRLLITDINEITKAPKHRIGLWPRCKIILGTKEANYTQVQWTNTQEPKTAWKLTSVSLPLTLTFPYATIGVTPTFVVARRQIKINPNEAHPMVLLKNFQNKPILLYDPELTGLRAWLVPTLSLILHIAHLYLRHEDLEDCLPYVKASSEGGAAAMSALQSCQDNSIIDLPGQESSKLTTWDLLERITLNIISKPSNVDYWESVDRI